MHVRKTKSMYFGTNNVTNFDNSIDQYGLKGASINIDPFF